MESALTDFKVRRLCIIYTTVAYYTRIYIFCQEVIVFIKGKAAANQISCSGTNRPYLCGMPIQTRCKTIIIISLDGVCLVYRLIVTLFIEILNQIFIRTPLYFCNDKPNSITKVDNRIAQVALKIRQLIPFAYPTTLLNNIISKIISFI